MKTSVFLELLLVLQKTPFRILELRLQEDIGALGQILAVATVLVDEERRQAGGDLLRCVRVFALVTDPE